MLYTSFNEWVRRREALIKLLTQSEAVTGLEDTVDFQKQVATLYHGATTSSAQNIMSKGLQDRSKFDIATNMAGEFWATSNYHYASLMSFMPGFTQATAQDPPVVLQFQVPYAAIRRILKRELAEEHGLGTYEFKARCFKFLNEQINRTWKVLPLEAQAAQKWKEELVKQAA